jgi:hypothetical protein
MTLLINPTNANLGANIAFIFLGTAYSIYVYLFSCFPEMKGRSYLDLEDMFQRGIPARKFKDYNCEIMIVSAPEGEKVLFRDR